MIDLIFVLAYARASNKKLNVSYWPSFAGNELTPAFRETDARLENVRAHLVFPTDVVFNSPCSRSFEPYLGGGTSVGDFHRAYVGSACSRDDFERSIGGAARDFSFCQPILDFLGGLPTPLIGVHVRRSDKFRARTDDGSVLPSSALPQIDALTLRAIDHFAAAGHTHFFVCGDEDEKTVVFKDRVRAAGAALVSLPEMPKWRSTYYDLAVMSRCAKIVVSHTGSNFSRLAAMIGGTEAVPVTSLKL